MMLGCCDPGCCLQSHLLDYDSATELVLTLLQDESQTIPRWNRVEPVGRTFGEHEMFLGFMIDSALLEEFNVDGFAST